MPKYYEVYDANTGDFLVNGTSDECAEKLGILRKSFTEAFRCGSKKYDIVEIGDPETEAKHREKAIKDWNETVERLRKQLGMEE